MNGKTVVVERCAAGVARRRDRRPGPQRPQDVRQRRRTDRVDSAGPPFRFERPALAGHLVPCQDPGRAHRPEAGRLVGLAGRRPDLVAAVGQDRQRRATDPARGPGHEHRPVVGREPAILERGDGHRRREAGRPDRHRVARRQARRQRHDPAGRHALVLGEAAVARDAQVVAVGEHLRPDRDRAGSALETTIAREVDARDERADPGDLAVGPRRQAVLVVDARPGDPDLDLAGRQVGLARTSRTPRSTRPIRPATFSATKARNVAGMADIMAPGRSARRRRMTRRGCISATTVDDVDDPGRPSADRDSHPSLLEHVYALAAPPCGGWGLRSRAT